MFVGEGRVVVIVMCGGGSMGVIMGFLRISLGMGMGVLGEVGVCLGV